MTMMITITVMPLSMTKTSGAVVTPLPSERAPKGRIEPNGLSVAARQTARRQLADFVSQFDIYYPSLILWPLKQIIK